MEPQSARNSTPKEQNSSKRTSKQCSKVLERAFQGHQCPKGIERSQNGAWSTLGWHSEAQELHLQLPGSIMTDYGCQTSSHGCQNRSKNGAWSTSGWHGEAQELHLQLPGSIMRDYGCQTGSHGCPEGLPRRAKIITNEMKSRRQKESERGGGKRPPKRLSKTPF